MGRGLNEDMNQLQTDVSTGNSISKAIVESVAEAEGTDPSELTTPLYDVIEPDALEALFANDRAFGKVIFNYEGYEVSVFPDGYVSVKSHGTQLQTVSE